MKYIVLVADGMADLPLPSLGGKTPLEVAKTENMDFIAANGITGMVRTIPKNFPPGSDIAALSIFGYNPASYYTGRGPLEAANMGIKLKRDDVAFRCNLVTIREGIMEDFTAGHITNEEAKKLIKFIDKNLGSKTVRFYPGVSYRHLTVIENCGEKALCVPPHDITGKPIIDYLPKGPSSDLLRILMKNSVPLLALHPINVKRMSAGKREANMIWLWGQGKTPRMPSYKNKYGLTGSVITAVNLIKGIGIIVGLTPINVPGATGYYDTNYLGKAQYALRALKREDFVLVHVEAPDEAGHMGEIKEKIRAIENFDRLVVGTILKGLKKFKDFRILVMPDHPTPISKLTHTEEPVPFAIYEKGISPAFGGIKAGKIKKFTEKAISKSKLKIKNGYKLMDFFIKSQ